MRQGGAVNGEMMEGPFVGLLFAGSAQTKEEEWVKTQSQSDTLDHPAIKDAINRPSDKFITRRLSCWADTRPRPPGILTDGRTD